ncbi:Uncharacterised protein [Moraxella lacunata]|uniref:Lipoprotein n=1 Tax=Moraxella lacunata TaxID=477 RepID=A0A378TTJ1_MORLA|nr:hypothetical protein [Moraxella lacunata]STZ63270.1 Uncharacterised protein [Moraxella lacunata]
MKKLLSTLITAGILVGCASTPATPPAMPSLLVMPNTKKTNEPLSPDTYVDGVGMLHFRDYHAKVTYGDRIYLLDSYVVPLEQPFYIHVRTADGTAIMADTAVKIAISYITPKGCTEPLVRRADLDKSTNDKSEWIIGVAC